MENFGKIKTIFNNLLVESLFKKDDTNRKLFKKYIKTIRESEILKTQFLIYDNIENKVESDLFQINLFVSENIKLLEKFSPADIIRENKKLVSLLDSKTDLNEVDELSPLHEALTNLIFTTRRAQNIDSITRDTRTVVNHISTNKEKALTEGTNLPLSMLTKIMVEKYNEKYAGVNEDDKKILKVLINNNPEANKKLHEQINTECTDIVNGLLKEANDDTREKLLKVRSKLLETTELRDVDVLSKIFKLLELKNNLKN